MVPKEIGNRLRRLRGEKTIREVSEATGIEPSTIGMYELGLRTPRDSNKEILADYFGLTVQELFYDRAITDSDTE